MADETPDISKRARRGKSGDAPVANNPGTRRPGGVTGKGFMPGQSGNPTGRPKKRPVSAVLLKMLAEKTGRANQLKIEALVERLVSLALDERTRPRDVIEAFRLIAAYADGLPVQVLELDVYDAARAEAERRGLDPERVTSILDGLRNRRAG